MTTMMMTDEIDVSTMMETMSTVTESELTTAEGEEMTTSGAPPGKTSEDYKKQSDFQFLAV